MDISIIPEDEHESKATQLGPPWHCWECGAQAERIVNWNQYLPAGVIPKPVDAWGEYIWYMILPHSCQEADHKGCSARLGDVITPLTLYPSRGRTNETVAIAHVRAALGVITAAHGADVHADPITAIVWSLATGVTLPDKAMTEINAIIQQAIRGALVKALPELAFQTNGGNGEGK